MQHSPPGHAFTEIIIETFKLNGLLVVAGDRMTAPLGLSSARWKILGALARSETPPTVPQIARLMGQTRQAVQRLVDAMHADGLLEFHPNPEHKRAKLVAWTVQGEAAYRRTEKIQTPWANRCAEPISLRDLETTLSTLRKISDQVGT